MSEQIKTKPELVTALPTIALRGLTIFPNVTVHFEVSRLASVKALELAMTQGKPVFLVGQRNIAVESPQQEDLYSVGTISTIRQILRMPADNVRVLVEGQTRAKLCEMTQTQPFLMAQVQEIAPAQTPAHVTAKQEALMRQVYELVEQYIELSPKASPDILLHILSSENVGYIADLLAQNIPMRHSDKQKVLELLNPMRRLEKLHSLLEREVEILALEEQVQSKTREQIAEHQRDYYLREQLKAIQGELGEGEDEIVDYREKIAHAKLPVDVEKKLNKELDRLAKQPYASSEATVLRNYLDTCLELPWGKKTKEKISVTAAQKILDKDHFGLEKVKERILEVLAVKQLSPEIKGQILCLVGPPGVGKTSIAQSVARATNRNLARIALGGVSDEAEIRGHRKTYVGAMTGRIIAAVQQAGSCNPLILLDEIDKLGRDHRGDPASALLEVLDAEQNATYRDNFLEIPFDLSDVMFITTANTTDTIPRPLLDRMDVIELPSYTDEEKLQIAKKYLLPKQKKKHGLPPKAIKISDDTLREIIATYTRESGVRMLERRLAALCRKAAMELVNGEKAVALTEQNLARYLGAPKYHPERQALEERVGVVNGLAWTSVGGELLEIEVNVVAGTGKVELTGNLGEVMKESAHAALSFIRAQSAALQIPQDFYKEKDIHVHFPEGAVPKDGPSAGVGITTAMVSALTGIPVRRGIAMTGEVTLRGRVLPIGGLREKTMAAFRNGIKTVIIPADNGQDLEEIDQTVRNALHFVLVERAQQVLAAALCEGVSPTQETNENQGDNQSMPVQPVLAPVQGGAATRLRQ